MTRPLNILTWHVHGSYLYYLSHVPHRLYLPVKPERDEGYGGRLPGMPWPDSVQDVPADRVRELDLDCILFQSSKNFTADQYEILSPEQRRLPRIFLEHDPPREHPTDTPHVVDDPDVLLVHVTAFNELMWDSRRTPTTVIEHGVIVPRHARYSGELESGIVVVNGLAARGRRLGLDLYSAARERVPLELVGMQSEALGGLGEIPHAELPALVARYRFFFSPIRYTSLGLAMCEAMAAGVPIVAFATTEVSAVVENGVSGIVDTRLDTLVDGMQRLLADPNEARRLGAGARRTAVAKFGIARFVRDWNEVLEAVTGRRRARSSPERTTEPGVYA